MKQILIRLSLGLGILLSFASYGHEDCPLDAPRFLPSYEVIDTNAPLPPDKNEKNFKQIMNRVIGLYQDSARAQGMEIIGLDYWEKDIHNAFADRREGRWLVSVFGGMYRNPKMSNDGYALVVCHEIGHHLGGPPLSSKGFSIEGQADYWASSVCLKEYFRHYPEKVSLDDGDVKRSCDRQFSNDTQAQNDCYRGVLAGLSLSNVLQGNLLPSPSLTKKSDFIAPLTFEGHPSSQCRLDTFISGSLCSPEDQGHGNEPSSIDDLLCQDALTRGFEDKRPRCWFHPYLRSIKLEWDKRVQSKTRQGFTKSQIRVSFQGHYSGNYQFKLTPLDSALDFVKIFRPVYSRVEKQNNPLIETSFDYRFTQKINKPFQMILTIELDDQRIYEALVNIEPFSTLFNL